MGHTCKLCAREPKRSAAGTLSCGLQRGVENQTCQGKLRIVTRGRPPARQRDGASGIERERGGRGRGDAKGTMGVSSTEWTRPPSARRLDKLAAPASQSPSAPSPRPTDPLASPRSTSRPGPPPASSRHPPRPPPPLPPRRRSPPPARPPRTPLWRRALGREVGEGRDAPERAERGEGAAGPRGEGSSAVPRATPPTSGDRSRGGEARLR